LDLGHGVLRCVAIAGMAIYTGAGWRERGRKTLTRA
jgi:hypothetical protein